MNDTKNQYGFAIYLVLALVLLVLGVILHAYNENIHSQNNHLEKQHRVALANYQKNNIYYSPASSVDWLMARHNSQGFFVTNPDLINEPSQYNKNSLRATRYATATLAEMSGLNSLDSSSVLNFLKRTYQTWQNEQGETLAGFSTLKDTPLGVRPTMDAILTLHNIGQLDNQDFDLNAVSRYILSHQNADGGFWDPHYPSYGQNSCLKCTSFALRSLGHINRQTNQQLTPEIIEKVIAYINASWDPENQGYSQQIGSQANDSYDIFRAFIILWNLRNQSIEERQQLVLKHLKMEAISASLNNNFKIETGGFSRNVNGRKASMKATHLMVWMHHELAQLHQLEDKKIIDFVMSHKSSPGEYDGDIYNTYSALGILKKFGVSSSPLEPPAPLEVKAAPLPKIAPYVLYLLSLLLFIAYSIRLQSKLTDKNTLLESKINKDNLTGLYNREYLIEAFDYHHKSGEQLSLVLIDIDHFKSINDNFGHLKGDQALQEFSALISSSIRKTDILVRWGGEEFAILCPATSSEPATTLAEKLRGSIEQQNFATIDHMTASFGISSVNKEDDLDKLFERADRALYQSKADGRNTINYC